jgi:hypothetical protein
MDICIKVVLQKKIYITIKIKTTTAAAALSNKAKVGFFSLHVTLHHRAPCHAIKNAFKSI